MMIYNDTESEATDYTLYFVNIEKNMSQIENNDTNNSTTELEVNELAELQKQLKENLKFIARRIKKSADTKRKNHNIAIEDHVFLNTKNMNFKRNSKLFHVRVESFKVINQKEKVVFILELLKEKNIHSTFHVALFDKAHSKISLQKN